MLQSETKLDASLTTAQFSLSGLSKIYRFGSSSSGANILLYMRDYMLSWLLTEYGVRDNLKSFT